MWRPRIRIHTPFCPVCPFSGFSGPSVPLLPKIKHNSAQPPSLQLPADQCLPNPAQAGRRDADCHDCQAMSTYIHANRVCMYLHLHIQGASASQLPANTSVPTRGPYLVVYVHTWLSYLTNLLTYSCQGCVRRSVNPQHLRGLSMYDLIVLTSATFVNIQSC